MLEKEEVILVSFNKTPKISIRTIDCNDDIATTASKKKYPFQLMRDCIVTVETTKRVFSFRIPAKYCWNGADLPKPLWWLGSSKDNDYVIASMVHDFILERKEYVYKEVLGSCISIEEYRRLTSLIFRQILKEHKTNPIKANVMAWAVDVFQATLNKDHWNL